MIALDLWTDLRRAGVELFADAGRLRFRAPAGALTASMREAAAACREELLSLLAARIAAVLNECETAINTALASAGLTPTQKNVAEVLRGVVRTHAERGDPLLWSDRTFLAEQFAVWRKVNAATAARRKR